MLLGKEYISIYLILYYKMHLTLKMPMWLTSWSQSYHFLASSCCSLSNSQGLGWYGTMTGCGSNSYAVSPHLNGPMTDTAPLLFTCSNLDMSNHHSLYVTPQNWQYYQAVILPLFSWTCIFDVFKCHLHKHSIICCNGKQSLEMWFSREHTCYFWHLHSKMK